MKVDEKPNYSYLRFILEMRVLDLGYLPQEDIYCYRMVPLKDDFKCEDEDVPQEIEDTDKI